MYSNKKIWNISYPIMLSLLAQNIINITDTAFLGRVGEIELGGSALGGLWYLSIFMAGFGFSLGVQILIGRRNGENKLNRIAPLFIQGLFFLLFLAILFVASTSIVANPLLKAIIKSDAVFEATRSFLDWRMYGLIFAFPNVLFRALYVGITQTRVLTTSAIVMAIVNIFLDYIMIFGRLGCPEMGLEGAAIASVIAEGVAMLYFIGYTLRKINLHKYGFFRTETYTFKQLPHILNISVWTMIQYFVALGTWFIFFLATEHLGERSLAVSNIVRSISSLLFMPVSAYATTANTLVSNLMGEGRLDQIAQTLKKIFLQCIYIVLPLMFLIFIAPRFWVKIYTDNSELIKATIPSLFVLTSSYLVTTPGSILFQFVSGTGNTRSALWMEMLTLVFYLLFVFITAFYLQLPVAICWFSEHLYWGSLLIISYIYYKRANWQSRKI